jgi:hypothetical protein
MTNDRALRAAMTAMTAMTGHARSAVIEAAGEVMRAQPASFVIFHAPTSSH